MQTSRRLKKRLSADICVDEEPESTEQGTASRSGGMLQSQMNETVTKVRQALRTED